MSNLETKLESLQIELCHVQCYVNKNKNELIYG